MNTKPLYVFLVLPLSLALLLRATNVDAARWFDDFSDGNVSDGSPLTWSPHVAFPGNYNASSGNYVLSGISAADDDEILLSTIENETFSDVSVRVRGRVGGQGNLGLVARVDLATLRGYVAVIDDSGLMVLISSAPPADLIEIQSVNLSGQSITAATDVMLQLDIVGNRLSVTAWRPDDPMPAPQITATDGLFQSGVAGIVFAEDANGSSGIFVHADAVSIITGDTNRTGTIERGDVVTIVNNLGTPLEPILATGDVDADGLVGIGDLAIVQSRFGNGTSPSPVAVPEPASMTLLIIAMGLLSGRLVRRRRR